MSGPNSGSHSLGRLRTTGFSQHSPITCVSYTSGCSSQENLDTQHKHPGACYGPSAREHCDHSPGSNSFSGSSELAQLILPEVKEGRITSAQVTQILTGHLQKHGQEPYGLSNGSCLSPKPKVELEHIKLS